MTTDKKKNNTNSALNLANSYDTFTDTFTPLSHLCVFSLPRAKSKGRECLLERNNELNLKEACESDRKRTPCHITTRIIQKVSHILMQTHLIDIDQMLHVAAQVTSVADILTNLYVQSNKYLLPFRKTAFRSSRPMRNQIDRANLSITSLFSVSGNYECKFVYTQTPTSVEARTLRFRRRKRTKGINARKIPSKKEKNKY